MGKTAILEDRSFGTKYPELFAALAREFDPSEVKTLPKGNKPRYVTARTVMNRLDEVLGPENWWDDYTPDKDSVLCRLTIRLPDGSTLTKADAGGAAGMADAGDDDKSMYSDALKRAAVRFGPGRYLYRDGVPDFGGSVAPAAAPNNNTGYGRGQYASPAQVEAYANRVGRFVETRNSRWLDEWTRPETGEVAEGIGDLLREEQVTGHMVKWGIASGRLAPLPDWADPETGEVKVKASTQQARQYAAIILAREPEAFADEAERYYRDKADQARAAWREKHGKSPDRGDAFEG